MPGSYPRKRIVWNRAVLGGIVNAIKTAESETFGCFEGWARNHYVLNGIDGREGVITFAGGHWYPDAPLVGVFYDVHSERFHPSREWDVEQVLTGCPMYQRSLAEQGALHFLRLEHAGKILHRVTAAFWDNGDVLAAANPWDEVVVNGASLISEEMVDDLDEALSRFVESYDLTETQIALAKSLSERKIACPPALIELSRKEIEFLESTFEDPKQKYDELDRLAKAANDPITADDESKKPESKWWDSMDTNAEFEKAMKCCREKFAELGILFP